MYTLKYTLIKGEYEYDDYGNEEFVEHEYHLEAQFVYRKPAHYCDAVEVYYAPECTEEIADEVERQFYEEHPRVHQFCPTIHHESVPYGIMFMVREPYDD